jgi:hypothetical protein
LDPRFQLGITLKLCRVHFIEFTGVVNLAALPFNWGTPWFLPLVGAYFRYKDRVG